MIADCSQIKSPIVHGQVKDPILLEKVFETFCDISGKNEKKKFNDENMIFMTSGIRWDSKTYGKIMEFFFEKLGYNELGFGLEGVAALYAHAQTTGLVIDSGDTLSKVFTFSIKLIFKSIRNIFLTNLNTCIKLNVRFSQ